MIARRQIVITRSVQGALDAEGRDTAASSAAVQVTSGHLVRRDIATTSDGRIVTSASWRALLQASADVRPGDVLTEAGIAGPKYRVLSVTRRHSPFGGVHHLSCECEVSS